jgi:Tfp pilus assembly pilus retraction ATPase PilT
MRPTFQYESDAALLKRIFVPLHLDSDSWDVILTDCPPGTSLLECIGASSKCPEPKLLHILKDICGVDAVRPWPRKQKHTFGAEAQILQDNGFCIIDEQTVCGGPDLPPNLNAYIGSSSRDWNWCLVAPSDHGPLPRSEVAEALQEDYARPTETTDLDSLLLEMLAQGVRDIHFERLRDRLQIRALSGNKLIPVGEWGDPIGERWIRIIKQRSGMVSDGQALPEDGRIQFQGAGQSVSFRVGRIPTLQGESIVLRPVEGMSGLGDLQSLGVPDNLAWTLHDIIHHEPGLILFCGVTSSGKTTTACSLLQELAHNGLKIITIEDPVEYLLPSVQQSAVNLAAGWSFPVALKAYLRQDPDIILVGEIRDKESARIACRAGLTGHSVLATLHAANTTLAYERLRGWQIEEGLLQESIRLIVHQRMEYDTSSRKVHVNFTTWQPPVAQSQAI